MQNQLIPLLKQHKITKKIRDAFEKVDRKNYFDSVFHNEIYTEARIPLGYGQKSDNPLILTKMIQILSPQKKMRILEVGTGSGYSTAVLSSMVSQIVTVEYDERLARMAKERITKQGITNITFLAGDATEITDELGSFDAIIILAACRQTPLAILESLAPGGTAVFPMGPIHEQQIVEYHNNPEPREQSFKFHDLCVFEIIRCPYGWEDIIEGYIVDDAKI